MNEKEIYLRIVWGKLPEGVHGASSKDFLNGFIILLNSNETQEEQEKAAVHELLHVLRGDHDDERDIDEIEKEAHRRTDEILSGEG